MSRSRRSSHPLRRRLAAAATAVAVIASLGACATTSPSSPIRVGWTGEMPPLDPAASASFGSFAFLTQIYPSLLTIEPERTDPVPEIAESAEWTAEGVYTVVLKPGLEFANGNALTTSDVKFSLERQLALQSPDGAWRPLAELASIDIVDETTMEFRVSAAADTGLPYVLAGPAGLVLDEETFFADELTPDADIVEAQPFAGPYLLTDVEPYRLTPFLDFGGAPLAATPLELRTGEAEALAGALVDGSIDVITGRLPAETAQGLSDEDRIEMARAASGRVRLLAFDLAHMPFGTRTEEADADQATALRVAIAEVVDRDALAAEVMGTGVEPLFGYVADGVPGADDILTELYGDGEGGPDIEAAGAALESAGIVAPVDLSIHVALDDVGELGAAEASDLASQLTASGLFSVVVVETNADELGAAQVAGEVQAVFTTTLTVTGDPREYLEPFRSNGLLAPGFGSSDVDALLDRSLTEVDPEVRTATLREAQVAVAEALPAIPITQGVRIVFVRGTVTGFALTDSRPLDLSRLRR